MALLEEIENHLGWLEKGFDRSHMADDWVKVMFPVVRAAIQLHNSDTPPMRNEGAETAWWELNKVLQPFLESDE